jgi:uncharacterized protein with PIN domain
MIFEKEKNSEIKVARKNTSPFSTKQRCLNCNSELVDTAIEEMESYLKRRHSKIT